MASNYQGFQYNPVQNSTSFGANFSTQQFFPQPQGSVYVINNSAEISTIPMGSGISTAICMSEGLMFLKTLQNGNPVLMAYKIIPYSQEQNNSSNNMDKESGEELQTLKNRVEEIEKKLSTIKNNSTGGSLLEYA
jgi:hypothetical protein